MRKCGPITVFKVLLIIKKRKNLSSDIKKTTFYILGQPLEEHKLSIKFST
jgi:hypothetical protein